MARPRKQYPTEDFDVGFARKLLTEVGIPTEKLTPAPSCTTCTFRHWNGSYAECRRYPPPFAVVNGTDWCGEFKAKV